MFLLIIILMSIEQPTLERVQQFVKSNFKSIKCNSSKNRPAIGTVCFPQCSSLLLQEDFLPIPCTGLWVLVDVLRIIISAVPKLLYEQSLPLTKRYTRHYIPWVIAVGSVKFNLIRCLSGTLAREFGILSKNDELQ